MEYKTFEVEMLAFANGQIRKVDVPTNQLNGLPEQEILETIFYWGQNDFQPREFPSVSVGDVVRLNGKRFAVSAIGWKELK